MKRQALKQALRAPVAAACVAVIDGLPNDYFDAFDTDRIVAHMHAVERVLQGAAVAVADRPQAVTAEGESAVVAAPLEITVCARDRAGLFALLTGALGAARFNIENGLVFTSTDGVAIDTFRGSIPAGTAPEAWFAAFEPRIRQLLETAVSASMEEARDMVAEMVASTVAAGASDAAARRTGESTDNPDPLLPISIEMHTETQGTKITVRSQDTPFFLFSLATALTLQGVNIERVAIKTVQAQVLDVFWVTDGNGRALQDGAELDRVRFAILVTKQFTHALPHAADPREAFPRFEELVRRVAEGSSTEEFQRLLADPTSQRELAQLLGASDFLWEDFIRLQYESLLPLLQHHNEHRMLSTPSEQLAANLRARLRAAPDGATRRAALNEFKDRESFLIDADHILRRNNDFFFLSHRLTRLAEVVVNAAFDLAWAELAQRHGEPRSAAGLRADYAIFGLGKLGGSALGFASDIELLFIYGDHGETDGAQTITNREFFERLVREATAMIDARREGIFRVDLRLRPYGADGPLAVHLESFIQYFSADGGAHSVERLALIRMRPIGGDAELGARITAIRDRLVYESDAIDITQVRELRVRQADEKLSGGQLNAKFSPGALVDLEYNVQLLQVEYGRANTAVRNPGIHATLRALSELGSIDAAEAEAMIRSYRFLRNLINALRMLRGNAQDLFLPEFGTLEFWHLSRRMGYRDQGELSAAEQLRVDFETETAAVRSFVERHLGQDAIPGGRSGNPADLILGEALSEEQSGRLLRQAGFRNPTRGMVNLRRIAGGGEQRRLFARLLVLAWEYLRQSSDPDMALNNWERFTEQVNDRVAFFRDLLAQPRRMEILFTIFAGSQFLSDTLIQNPEFLAWITDSAVIASPRGQRQMESELTQLLRDADDRTERLNVVRRFRKREILRIGTRDICLAGEFTDVVAEISALARTCTASLLTVALERADAADRSAAGSLAILAFGKLGGAELNYSSDIDLLGVYRADPAAPNQEARVGALFRQVVRDLSDFTEEGQAYRVDLRLRPYGDAGRLVYEVGALERYYQNEAEIWELQALLKLGPIAGNETVARETLAALRPHAIRRIHNAGRAAVYRTVRHLRRRAVDQYGAEGDVKNGIGGIRDIEFTVQTLQLAHQHQFPELITGNTLIALEKLEEAAILPADSVAQLKRDYVLLRRVEHFLQVYQDQQLHAIPAEPEAQAKLARLVLGAASSSTHLVELLEQTLERVRTYYDAYVPEE